MGSKQRKRRKQIVTVLLYLPSPPLICRGKDLFGCIDDGVACVGEILVEDGLVPNDSEVGKQWRGRSPWVDLWLQYCLLGVLHVDTLQNHFPYMSIGDRSVNYVFRTTWIWWWSATGMLLTVIFTTQVKRIWCVWLDTWPGFPIIWIKAKSGLDVSHYKRFSKTVVHTSIAAKSKIFCPDITKKISNATDKSTEYRHTRTENSSLCMTLRGKTS